MKATQKEALSNLFIALLAVHYGAIWIRLILFPNSDIMYIGVNLVAILTLGLLMYKVAD